jgi:hypothetical protein
MLKRNDSPCFDNRGPLSRNHGSMPCRLNVNRSSRDRHCQNQTVISSSLLSADPLFGSCAVFVPSCSSALVLLALWCLPLTVFLFTFHLASLQPPHASTSGLPILTLSPRTLSDPLQHSPPSTIVHPSHSKRISLSYRRHRLLFFRPRIHHTYLQDGECTHLSGPCYCCTAVKFLSLPSTLFLVELLFSTSAVHRRACLFLLHG